MMRDTFCSFATLRRRSGPVLTVLVVALVASVVLAQRPEEVPRAFTGRIDVEIVNLDVVVTDQGGHSVGGLNRDDFELLVDGQPTPIANFYAEVSTPSKTTEPRGGALDGEDTAAVPETDIPGKSEDQAVRVLVLFDNRHATPGERRRVVKDLADQFASDRSRNTQVAVMVYDGSVQLRQPFTSQRVAAATIRRLASENATGYTHDFDRRNLLRQIEETSLAERGAAAEAQSLLASIELYIEQRIAEIERMMDALDSQVDALAGLPGRKILLYVASGLDLRPGRSITAAWSNKFGHLPTARGPSNLELATGRLDLGGRLRELTRRANASRVTFYAIGTAGAGTSSAVSAEHGGFDLGALAAPGAGRAWDATIDATFRADQGSGLELMAAVTGGDALTGSGNYDLIAERIRQDASHHYSLGFRDPGGEPGRAYRLEVRVPGRDVRLRHRREYVSAASDVRASQQVLSTLVWGATENPIAIAADFGPVQAGEAGEGVTLPILVKIPFVNLVLVPEERFHRGQVTIFVAARDAKGRVSPVQTLEAPIRVPHDRLADALGGVAGYRLGLLVRPGPREVAIGVRDELANVVSTIRLQHEVVTPPDAE